MFCREQAAQLGAIEPDLAALGVRLVFVGNGSPAHAAAFRADQGVRAPLYVDPSLASYRLLGFASGAASTFSLASVGHAARALLAGHRQGAIAGSPLQQGGVVLLTPDGATPYVYRSREAGDHPAPGDLLATVRTALAG